MNRLRSIIAANRAGKTRGLPSWCTAHPQVLKAILRSYHGSDDIILIEATCNQVNQDGGYTNMTPVAFRHFIETLADEAGIARSRIVLGGDHLGPNPWKSLPAAAAMAKARQLVKAYVEAGFSKIHLDASMACADDANLSEAEMARRAAELAQVAQACAPAQGLNYIIGTEVPVPGGETQVLESLVVTQPASVQATWAAHQQAFTERGLEAALSRIIGLVVQPGVDFGNEQIFAFQSGPAASLSACIAAMPGMVFEAHSTDFQSEPALQGLVQAHFALLKVGPELTFAFREAVFAMATIEAQMNFASPSDLIAVLGRVMDEHPRHWQDYIPDGPDRELMKYYGLSDRLRYYWPEPAVQAALNRLFTNIDHAHIPPGLLWQYAGRIADGADALSTRIIDAKIGAVVARYRRACGERV